MWCRPFTVVLCCGIFFVVWVNSAGSHSTINLFLASSSRKKYAQYEYNGGLFGSSTFGCRNHVLVAAMVRSSLQAAAATKKKLSQAYRGRYADREPAVLGRMSQASVTKPSSAARYCIFLTHRKLLNNVVDYLQFDWLING